MKLYSNSECRLLYSEKWPDGLGRVGWMEKQAYDIVCQVWKEVVSLALPVANEEEVRIYMLKNGIMSYIKKPDTFYEIKGATAEVKYRTPLNTLCDFNLDGETKVALIHLPQENKPEYANSDETPVERELSKLIAKHIMGWTLDPNKIEAVKKVANEFRSVKTENSDPFNHTDSLIKELEFVKTSNREICIELESLRKENRELKSKLEYILSEIDSVGEYHPNYSGEIEDIRNLIQKHS